MNGLSGNGTIDNYSGNGPAAGGRSTLNCGSNDVSSTFSGVIQNRYYDASIDPTKDYVQIAKFGAGTFTLTGANTFNGNVTVNAGVLRITCQNGDGVTGGGLGLGSQTIPPTKTISITSSAGDAGLHLLGTNGPIIVDSSMAFQTAGANGAIVNEAGNNTINGSISLRTGGATTIRVDGDSLTLAGNINILANVTSRTLTLSGVANGTVSGVISDGSSANNPNTNVLSLTKSGAGTWTLSADNSYSGGTTVSEGTLLVNGSLGTNTVTVNGGTLGGTGTINGPVVVNAAGVLSPGASIGTLAISNSLSLSGTNVMEINKVGATLTGDKIIGVTSLTYGGVLHIIASGNALAAGDSIKLYYATSYGDAFASIVPPTPGANLAWDTTGLANGTLAVKTAALPQPTISGVQLSGSNLILTGSGGQPGGTYYVVSSTNVALSPLSLWTPVHTNTFDGSGAFSNNIPVSLAVPRDFFLIKQ